MSESEKKGSCFKRIAIGCGGLIAIFIFLGVLITASAVMNQPAPVENVDLNTTETFASVSEGGLNLPETARPNKPVRLVLDLSMAELKVSANDEQGKVHIGGSYDKANFELTTDVKEKDAYIEYRIKFESKRNGLGMALGSVIGEDFHDIENRLEISLPKDLLLQLEAKTKMGVYHYNLGGLAVDSLDLESSMSEHHLNMMEPNQVVMSHMRIQSDTCESVINDLQNFRFARADLASSMGELRMVSTGPLAEDTHLNVHGKMGGILLTIPENAQFRSSTTAFLGEVRLPSREPEVTEGVKTFELTGGVTMGGLRISRRKPGSRDGMDIAARIQRQGLATFLEEVETAENETSGSHGIRPNELNTLGYSLMSRNKHEEALEVFILNTRIYPDWANSYDSLGECYAEMERYEPALENYKKALAMSPGNQRVMDIIEDLEAKVAMAAAGVDSNNEGDFQNGGQ